MFKNLNIALTAFIFAAGLSSVSLAAEFEGNIEIGATMVDTDNESAKFSEYRGIGGDNTYPVGNIDLSYNSEGYYLDLIGKDLGLNTRNVRMDNGIYGRYNFFLEYDEISKVISNNSRTIFNGAGSNNLTLPAGYVGNGSTSNPKTLVDQIINGTNGLGGAGNLKKVDLETDRRAVSAGFSLSSLKGLIDFNVSFKREEKQGTKSIGAVSQSSPVSGAGPRSAVVLPEPVDYTTDELDATISYNREKTQLEAGYHLSLFNNDNSFLKWQNPYYYGAPNPVISLPPDNKYERMSLSGGVNLPAATRVSFVAEMGKMTQDDNFLSYHANPASTANGTEPRSSADAAIDTKLLNANLSSRPVSGLGLNASYRHYETDNKTPVSLYRYPMDDGQNGVTVTTTGNGPAGSIYADGISAVGLACTSTKPCYSGFTSVAQGQAGATSAQARYNEPYDYKQDLVKADLSYLILKNTTFSAGVAQDVINRDGRERDRTTEETYKAGVKTNLTGVSLGANYLIGKRRGDTYNGRAILDSHPGTTSTSNPNWVNHPDLRKMDIADRDREKYGAFLSIFPADNTTMGISFSKVKDGFPDTDGFNDFNNTTVGFLESQLGIKENSSESVTIDISTAVTEEVTLFTYVTNDEGRSKENGRRMSGTTTLNDPTYNWTSEIMDKNDIMGLGVNITLMKGKLTLTPDYTYARSTTSIEIAGGTNAGTITPMPDLHTERHTLNLTGKYKLTENVTVGANYLYETYTSDDWATEGMTLDNTATVPTALVPLSGSEPDYVAQAGTITVAYKW